MTVTELASHLNTMLQSVNAQANSNPNAQVATMPITQILGANEAYVCNTAVPTVIAFLGGDPEVPLT